MPKLLRVLKILRTTHNCSFVRCGAAAVRPLLNAWKRLPRFMRMGDVRGCPT
jgi:hypothetical protein